MLPMIEAPVPTFTVGADSSRHSPSCWRSMRFWKTTWLPSRVGDAGGPEPLDLSTAERLHISRVLRMVEGNKSRAARILGIDRRTLQRKGF